MLSTKQFNVYPDEKKFVAEASQLGRFLERIYPDACDLGFVLESARTGKESMWYETRTLRNSDGDAEAWLFLPTSETIMRHPQLKDWKVIIFND